MGHRSLLMFIVILCAAMLITAIIVHLQMKPTTLRQRLADQRDAPEFPLRYLERQASAYLSAPEDDQRRFVAANLSCFGMNARGEIFLFNRKETDKVLMVKDVQWGQGRQQSGFLKVVTRKTGDPLLDPCGVFVEENARSQEKKSILLVAEGTARDRNTPTAVRLRAFVVGPDSITEIAQTSLDAGKYLPPNDLEDIRASAQREESEDSGESSGDGAPRAENKGLLPAISAMAAFRPFPNQPDLVLFLGRGSEMNTIIQLYADFSTDGATPTLQIRNGGDLVRHDRLNFRGQGSPLLSGLYFFPRIRSLFILGAADKDQKIPCILEAGFPAEYDQLLEKSGAPLAEMRLTLEESFLLAEDPARNKPSCLLFDPSGNLYILCKASNHLEPEKPFFYRFAHTKPELFENH